jgi:hypothetical protein
MADVNTTTTLDGLFKRIYAKRLENLIPDNARFLKMVKFDQNKRLGDTYEQPVVLANEHGVTYAAAGAGAFTLNSPIAMTTANARVPSNQLLLRSQIDYESASKASTGGDKAFVKATELVVKNMYDSMAHRLETCIIYGGVGIGKSSVSVNASTTTTVVTISDATWGVGLWAGAENGKINFYESDNPAANAFIGPAGGGLATDDDAVFTVVSVDVENKAITVSGTTTGISNLDSYMSTSVFLDIYWYGSQSNEMSGIDKQLTNTGTIFGIDASTYTLWKANTYNASGAITVNKLLAAPVNAIGKGGLNEEVCTFMSPTNWGVINTELGGKQQFDYGYKKSKVDYGFEADAIRMNGQSGINKVYSHAMVKDGEAFILPMSCIKRFGSTDITFNNPGKKNEFFRELTDKAGFELRNYTDQTIFIDSPAKCTKITGITV